MRTSQFPEQAARTHAAAVTLEEARSAAASDLRAFEHYKVQTLKGENFTAKVWSQERYTAKVTNLDTNEQQQLEASSRTDLNELLVSTQHNLLALRQQARVEVQPSRNVWITQLDFNDGTTERCEAPDYDSLLLTLLSWTGKTTAAAQPQPRPSLTLEDLEKTPVRMEVLKFLDAVEGQFTPSERNLEILRERMGELAWKKITYDRLIEAWHYCHDRQMFDEGEAQ